MVKSFRPFPSLSSWISMHAYWIQLLLAILSLNIEIPNVCILGVEAVKSFPCPILLKVNARCSKALASCASIVPILSFSLHKLSLFCSLPPTSSTEILMEVSIFYTRLNLSSNSFWTGTFLIKLASNGHSNHGVTWIEVPTCLRFAGGWEVSGGGGRH